MTIQSHLPITHPAAHKPIQLFSSQEVESLVPVEQRLTSQRADYTPTKTSSVELTVHNGVKVKLL